MSLDDFVVQLWRLLTLQDYNTRIVLLGASVFGAVAGLTGTFLLLRKRSLLGDTLSHATLPGVAAAFLVASAVGWSGKSLPLLMIGAGLSGVAGIGLVLLIRHYSYIKDDAALALVLSVFFGFGVALITAIQQLPGGNAAGLDHFIYGKTASMTATDAWFILAAAFGCGLGCFLLFKEFTLLCFDEHFAGASGWPVRLLDVVLMGLVVIITIVGLQAVGLLLVVAMLIIPPAAARFWSERLAPTAIIATAFGFVSSLVGVTASALFPRLPAGAVIVLAGAFFFGVSLIFGTRRGLFFRMLEQRSARERLQREHLLRAIYECSETKGELAAGMPVPTADLMLKRPWTHRELAREIESTAKRGLVVSGDGQAVALTNRGLAEARRLVRNHRLWEIYLLTYADVAASQVDRDADRIEHALDPRLVDELEDILDRERKSGFVPRDPHHDLEVKS